MYFCLRWQIGLNLIIFCYIWRNAWVFNLWNTGKKLFFLLFSCSLLKTVYSQTEASFCCIFLTYLLLNHWRISVVSYFCKNVIRAFLQLEESSELQSWFKRLLVSTLVHWFDCSFTLFLLIIVFLEWKPSLDQCPSSLYVPLSGWLTTTY